MENYSTRSNNKKWNNIMRDFNEEIILCFTNENIPYCIYDSKLIYFKYETFLNPSETDLFDLLHEIGHIQTNKVGMKRCLEEYLATQWALDHIKKYNVNVSKNRIKTFQNYIWNWRLTGIKRKGKNMPTIEELTLRY